MVRSLSSFAIPHFPSLHNHPLSHVQPLLSHVQPLGPTGGWRKIPSTYSPSSSKSEGPRWGRGNSLTEEDALHQQLMIFLIHSKLEGEDSSETCCCQAFSVPHAVLTHHIYHPACACRQLWAVTSYYG